MVSVLAFEVSVIPVPATKVKVSVALSATMLSWPAIAIVLKLFNTAEVAAMVIVSVIGSVVIVIFDPATNVGCPLCPAPS